MTPTVHIDSFTDKEVEQHPFEPFLPANARLLMLGTFPPAQHRWCMPWYYPNFTNDMWRIMGIILHNDKQYFVDSVHKTYHEQRLRQEMTDHGIALFDTCRRIIRTKGTASDKDLLVVEQTDTDALIDKLPQLQAVICAGQLSTDLFTARYHIQVKGMKMGERKAFEACGRKLWLYRMPSTSRAYPMPTEQKAEYYKTMMREIQMI